MIRRTPRTTLTDTRCPYTTRFPSRFSVPVLAGHEGSRAQRLIRLQSRPPPDDRAGIRLRLAPIRRGIFGVLPCNRVPGMRRHWSSFLFLATAAALLLAACSSGPEIGRAHV